MTTTTQKSDTTVHFQAVDSNQPSGYCFTVFAILKWVEVLSGVIVFSLGDWGIMLQSGMVAKESSFTDFKGYYYILASSIIVLAITFIFLMLYVCRHQQSCLLGCPWSKIEIVFNSIFAICYMVNLVLSSIEAHKVLKFNDADFRELNYVLKRWIAHVVAIAAFSALNVVLYIASAIYASRLVF